MIEFFDNMSNLFENIWEGLKNIIELPSLIFEALKSIFLYMPYGGTILIIIGLVVIVIVIDFTRGS